ncbi:hypothetical protein AKJ47_02920 [candidate division MSBL1 archaeon SCGC-AAA261G05]|uniref:Uncharacterized protein n=1 Tax=candidate division MSBL1 archaeon SCGC-AAA261G05 TaxID=1698276 RepID=A0A133V9C6_9EURY|nr:hypothetical protein AKJ47_02920 [candidate division MSBL1 archaeon SCGC-AAA261G05]
MKIPNFQNLDVFVLLKRKWKKEVKSLKCSEIIFKQKYWNIVVWVQLNGTIRNGAIACFSL